MFLTFSLLLTMAASAPFYTTSELLAESNTDNTAAEVSPSRILSDFYTSEYLAESDPKQSETPSETPSEIDVADDKRNVLVESKTSSLEVLLNAGYLVGGMLIICLVCYCFGLCCCDSCIESGKRGVGGRASDYQSSVVVSGGSYGMVPAVMTTYGNTVTTTGNRAGGARQEYIL